MHDSAEDLLGAVLPFAIANCSGDASGAKLRSGFLLIADKDRPAALVSLSATLGVDLSSADHRYALVEIRRKSGVAWHSGYQNGVFVCPNPAEPDPAIGVTTSSAAA